ncbi:hypothetical protein TNCV_2347151 [Trichonephila clavipes]|nr:hypothetical protein TNCV_2347151 [Trichonephila clavipes]
MDMSASRTDVASSVEVKVIYSLLNPCLSMLWQLRILLIIVPRAPSPRICAEFSTRFSSPSKTATQKHKITPERLRLVNLVQWAALKCSRRSIRLQNAEFKNTLGKLSFLDVPPLQPHPLRSRSGRYETPARIAAERRSVREAGEIGAKASSHIRLPRHIEDSSSMEEGESSAEESSVEIASAKSAKPVIAQSSPAAKAAESASAPDQVRKMTASLRGALRTGSSSLPNFCRRAPNYTKVCLRTKMRSHTFEMRSHNKQLKVVLRGLPHRL